MNNLLAVVAIFLGVFPLTSVLLVMVGQPVRPVSHLVKASAFWTVVVWVVVWFVLWRVM